MNKIFELTTKDFMSGVSGISHGLQGLFFSATGIAPFVNPRRGSNDFGLFQTFSAPTNMTAEVVVDIPWSWCSEATAANTGYLYILGSEGNLYVVNLFTNAISNERAAANKIANPSRGLAIYGGFLYYAQLTQIGQCTEATAPYDTSSTWDNDWSVTTGGAAALTSSVIHPLHLFSGRLWIGDVTKIHVISGGSSPAYAESALTFESDYTVMCLEDDGLFLVAGITQNQGDVTIMGRSKIVFWNTYSELPNREWEIPEAHISAIKKMGGWLYAVTSGGIYRFAYSVAPEKLPLTEGVDCLYGNFPAVDVLEGGMLLVGRRGDKITSYGPSLPGYASVVFDPFTGWAAGHGVPMIAATAKRGTIYFGTSDSKLYRQNIATGGAIGLSATTNFIPLRSKTRIEAIKIITGEKLASGDSLNIDVNNDADNTAKDWGTIAYTTHGAVNRITIFNSLEAENLQLVLNFNAGNVKIKKIEVWGTPEPTAL